MARAVNLADAFEAENAWEKLLEKKLKERGIFQPHMNGNNNIRFIWIKFENISY